MSSLNFQLDKLEFDTKDNEPGDNAGETLPLMRIFMVSTFLDTQNEFNQITGEVTTRTNYTSEVFLIFFLILRVPSSAHFWPKVFMVLLVEAHGGTLNPKLTWFYFVRVISFLVQWIRHSNRNIRSRNHWRSAARFWSFRFRGTWPFEFSVK